MLTSDDGTRFALDKGEITVLISLMPAVDKRPTLAALWFYPPKGQAWATDGHRCVLADAREPSKAPTGGRPVAIPAAAASQAAKAARARDFIVIDVSRPKVTIDLRAPKGRGVEIETLADLDSKTEIKHSTTCKRHPSPISATVIESFFPSYEPRGAKGAVMAVNPALLQSAAMLAKIIEPGFIWLSIGKAEDPMFCVAEGRHATTWRLVIMPWNAKRAPPPIIAGTSKPKTSKRASRGGTSKRRGLRSAS